MLVGYPEIFLSISDITTEDTIITADRYIITNHTITVTVMRTDTIIIPITGIKDTTVPLILMNRPKKKEIKLIRNTKIPSLLPQPIIDKQQTGQQP
jgi:hypothetical protein